MRTAIPAHFFLDRGGAVRTHIVLVDYENVQPTNLRSLYGRPFKIKIFLGVNQTKIPVEMAQALQVFGPDAEYIPIDGSGRNALDFHIAYHLGRLVAECPTASYYVISKDSGFDPLIAHLRSQKVRCQRLSEVSDIPLVKQASGVTVSEKAGAIVEMLAMPKATKPRTLQTLGRAIQAHFGNQLSDDELTSIVSQLTKRGVVIVSDEKVSYALPT
jgi:hypothetical protein